MALAILGDKERARAASVAGSFGCSLARSWFCASRYAVCACVPKSVVPMLMWSSMAAR